MFWEEPGSGNTKINEPCGFSCDSSIDCSCNRQCWDNVIRDKGKVLWGWRRKDHQLGLRESLCAHHELCALSCFYSIGVEPRALLFLLSCVFVVCCKLKNVCESMKMQTW